MMDLSEKDKADFLRYQRGEMTASYVYRRLASKEKNERNKNVLIRITHEEQKHYKILMRYTNREVKPDMKTVYKFYWIAKILGNTFAIKKMESSEIDSQTAYKMYLNYPDIHDMTIDENLHEAELIGMIDEERLNYMGSVVLGLNDALVEFTGALAGYTLALNNSTLIALTGSITGIAAALSMASSEYLSTKSDEKEDKKPVKAAVYTGIAYLITVVALIAPFILFRNVIVALVIMLAMALLIIAGFNYYYSVARGESFRKRFTEMAILSFSIAGLSFIIGYILKLLVGIG
jgi:VIT1/CCC1 family predicted Fe2+/Mn2+ transporter